MDVETHTVFLVTLITHVGGLSDVYTSRKEAVQWLKDQTDPVWKAYNKQRKADKQKPLRIRTLDNRIRQMKDDFFVDMLDYQITEKELDFTA